jgi:hypothetical protein
MAYTEADVARLTAVIAKAGAGGVRDGNWTLARWILHHWDGAQGTAVPACTHQDLIDAGDAALTLLRRFVAAYAPLGYQDELAAWQRTLDAARTADPVSKDPPDLHPLHQAVLQAVSALPAGPARVSLLDVVGRHSPAHWAPERDWITCSECAVLSWPPPLEAESMWSDVIYPCATIVGIADAFGLPADVGPATPIERLIEASSLGTAEAVLLRDRTSPEIAARILERSRLFDQKHPGNRVT